MKKIMFNDQYGLTQAVLDGRKTQTRRIVPYDNALFNFSPSAGICIDKGKDFGKCRVFDGCIPVAESRYNIGEVVAVAQPYREAIHKCNWVNQAIYEDTAGWNNKMFVSAEMMPYKIKVIDIRVERIQDISWDDCLKEGIRASEDKDFKTSYTYDCTINRNKKKWWHPSPFQAYRELYQKLYHDGSWFRNDLVFVYDFELVK